MTTFDHDGAYVLASETGRHSLLMFLDVICRRIGVPEGLDRYVRLEELGARGSPAHYDQLEPAFGAPRAFFEEEMEAMQRTGRARPWLPDQRPPAALGSRLATEAP